MKMNMKNGNPLLQETQIPLFDKILTAHYLPAFRESIATAEAELEAIASNPEPPTFENTLAAMDCAGKDFDRVSGIFFNLLEAEASAEMQQVAEEVVPLVTEYENRYFLNTALFRRVADVYDRRDSLALAEDEYALLDKVYSGFVRHGALLQGEQRERYRELNRLLSEKSLQYKNNVLAATAAYGLYFAPELEAALSGLPETERCIAAERAQRKGHADGWYFDLSQPSYTAFMKHAENRAYRQQLYMAYNSRALGGDHDNRGLVAELVSLRAELARLMGYDTYADYVLARRMLKSRKEVTDLLQQLLEAFRAPAQKELAEVTDFAYQKGFEGELQPWDWSFYQTRFQEERCAFDEQQLRPYFPLEGVKQGVFELACRLYGLQLRRNTSVPVYHPQVEVYDVLRSDGRPQALLYLDYFPRDTKRNGAWMTTFRDTYTDADGQRVLPQVSLVFNFTPPTAAQPSLLSFREVETFLHEFGHALHAILSEVRFASLSGTSVVRDFVELPSQLMENWALEKDFLNLFARHWQSGETLPFEWVARLKQVASLDVGYAMLRQLNFGFLDMAWHSLESPFSGDVEAFESTATRVSRLLPIVEHTAISTSFTHIFGGGYAAGYYGYKWSEVLSDDAYEAFAEQGVFAAEVAERFRMHILSRGGTADAMELYLRFRGRRPQVQAMLRKYGLDS